MPINPAPQSPVQRALTIPPPVMGWNTRDALSEMDPRYAVAMENYFPNRTSVDLRKGYRYHSKSIGSGAVIALGVLQTASVSRLVAVGSNNTIYDATTASAAATSIQGAISTANPFYYMQQFRDLLFIGMGLNAIDSVYTWSGTGNIAASTYTSALVGGFTRGLGPMTVYKSRLYFLQVVDGSGLVGTSIWYSPVDSTSGALTEFSFKSLLTKGGSAAFIGSVTRAKDFTEDQLFCIITTRGEVLVYQGDYPGSTTWSILGRYDIPRPLGLRAFFYIGADLHIITSQGIISMQAILRGERSGSRYATISDNIDEKFSEAATDALLDDVYWLGINYPKGNYALANIPITSGSVSHQYVVNTLSGAWTKFTGQNAFSWVVFGDNLYFGGLSGRVFKADNGFFDEDPASEGSVLTRTVQIRHAFNYLGAPSKRKKFVSVQPTIYQSEGLSLTVNCDVDYTDTTATSTETDTSLGTDYQIYQPKCGLTGPSGNAVSIRIDGTVTTKRSGLQASKVFWEEATDF